QVPRFAGRSLRCLSRRAIDAALEMGVAESAAAALGYLEPVPGFRQVADKLPGIDVMHHRAARHHHVQVFARLPALVVAGAGLAAGGAIFAADPEVGKRIGTGLCHQVDATAAAAVTPVRSALFNIFFAAKAERTVAAVAGVHADGRLVYEFHGCSLSWMHTKNP